MNNTVPFREDMPTSCTNPYGWTKMMLEQILQDLAVSDPEWSVVLLRYFNPIGAHPSGIIGENPNGIPNNLFPYIARVAAGTLPCLSVFGNDYDTPDGTGVRDYIHVSDLASAHWLALKYLAEGGHSQSLNLGTGKGISVLQMVQMAEKVIGHSINYEFANRRAGDPGLLIASSETANAVLGWTPVHSDLENMIRTTWAMYQK